MSQDQQTEWFQIYVRTYGKVRSGHTLKDADFGTSSLDGFERYNTGGLVAVSLAAEDAASKLPMKTRAELLAALSESTK